MTDQNIVRDESADVPSTPADGTGKPDWALLGVGCFTLTLAVVAGWLGDVCVKEYAERGIIFWTGMVAGMCLLNAFWAFSLFIIKLNSNR